MKILSADMTFFVRPFSTFIPMTIAGWITMTVVVGSMTSLLIWCTWKVVSTPGSAEHVHAPELDTPDMHESS